jgi:hypothetical protein
MHQNLLLRSLFDFLGFSHAAYNVLRSLAFDLSRLASSLSNGQQASQPPLYLSHKADHVVCCPAFDIVPAGQLVDGLTSVVQRRFQLFDEKAGHWVTLTGDTDDLCGSPGNAACRTPFTGNDTIGKAVNVLRVSGFVPCTPALANQPLSSLEDLQLQLELFLLVGHRLLLVVWYFWSNKEKT